MKKIEFIKYVSACTVPNVTVCDTTPANTCGIALRIKMNAPVTHRDIAVGMAGTFDVENYGDLLFPLIAAAALKRRDQRIRVGAFSVTGKSRPAWPFEVQPVHKMSASMSALSAM